jgi:hypothetical protein
MHQIDRTHRAAGARSECQIQSLCLGAAAPVRAGDRHNIRLCPALAKYLRRALCLRSAVRWSRLSEQIFRVDKWSPCRG